MLHMFHVFNVINVLNHVTSRSILNIHMYIFIYIYLIFIYIIICIEVTQCKMYQNVAQCLIMQHHVTHPGIIFHLDRLTAIHGIHARRHGVGEPPGAAPDSAPTAARPPAGAAKQRFEKTTK